MSAQRGEYFDFGVGHVNDRVFYEGREYRVQEFNRRTGLVWIIPEGAIEGAIQVNVDHLTLSWCPRAHGGAGRPQAAA